MELTDRQSDAVSELINIAFARTGAALSELTGQRVILNAPEVSMHPTAELPKVLAKFLPGEIASIHQVFAGPVAGDALLLLNHDGAVRLTDLLTDGQSPSSRLDESAREVLTEVGNILLNACLGMFGNLLDVHVSFSVPRLHLETLDELLDSLLTGKGEPQYALVIYTAFQIRDSAVRGFLVMVLSVASLDRLIQEVEAWEERQGQA
ncbi:MAG: chemotaxis protein CheC [Acidobacteriota bacterium]|jgi:chemotaxis protein CheC|nr:chemotaxis protein CheC [Acidobacteriota bacterium]MDT5261885.1 chemotaxis protein CheC [Acidobacteriota bacterium]